MRLSIFEMYVIFQNKYEYTQKIVNRIQKRITCGITFPIYILIYI